MTATIEITENPTTVTVEPRTTVSVSETSAAVTVNPSTCEVSVALSPVTVEVGAGVTVTVEPQTTTVTVSTDGGVGPGNTTLTYDAENKQGATLAAGEAVAVHSSGVGVVRASAADNTKPCIGLNTASASAAASATIQTRGPFELADWSAIIGSASLTRGPYFLDPSTPGRLNATAPTTSGQIAQPVGWAVSATILDLNPGPYVLL